MAEETKNRLVGLEQTQQEVLGQMNCLGKMIARLASEIQTHSVEEIPDPRQGQKVIQFLNSIHTRVSADNPSAIHLDTPYQGQPILPTLKSKLEVTKSMASKEKDESLKIKRLEERLKAIKETETHCLISVEDLCLAPGVVLPPKFKVPEFEKFNGTQSPKFHLTMYCIKMSPYMGNDKLLIHCFQESLTGGPLMWYCQLKNNHIKTWQDLVTAFLNQYKYITDLTPDRLSLQELKKESTASFQDYAKRWREVAAEVQPPLTEKELIDTFLSTLRGVYYEKMVHVCCLFST